MIQRSSSPIRIGVIGCGAIADLYHLPALAAHTQTKNSIVLADPNLARLSSMKQKFNAADSVTDYRELQGKVDGVIIATPPHLHYSSAKWFLENGVHVLCEKPLTESIEEARELVAASEKSGAKLAVNQTRRFFPTYQKIRELIANGTLGKIEIIRYHDGVEFDWPAASPHHFQFGAKGAWSDTGVHLLDSVCYWLDGKPTLLRSQNDSFGGPEAMATVHLGYDGCQIEIKVSRLGKLMNGFEIIGSLGTIRAESEDWDEITVEFKSGRQKRYKCASNRLKYCDFAKPMIANFVQVAMGHAEPFVSGQSTLATIELLEQAYTAATRYPMPWNEHVEKPTSNVSAITIGSPSPKRVLVTGAAGFLGARVVETMLISGFAKPVAAVRQWSRASRVACHPVEVVICDIMNPSQVEAAMNNIDAVVHCAYTADHDSIVNGTRNLLEAAVRHGVKKFVYLSSAEAYGTGGVGKVTEESEPQPTPNSYGDFKLRAERLCQEYHSRGLRPTILRPSLIYGPFGESWSIHIANRLQSGKWGLFDNYGNGIANLVYVDDLVHAIFLSLALDNALGQTFNVNGPEYPTWNAYFELLNESLNLPPLQRISAAQSRIKTQIMGTVGRVTDFFKSRFEDRLMEIYLRGGFLSRLMKKLKGELDSTPSSGELNNLFSRKACYDSEKIQKLLGYAPKFNLRKGIDKTNEWFILHEIVKRTDIQFLAGGCSSSLSSLSKSTIPMSSEESPTTEIHS